MIITWREHNEDWPLFSRRIAPEWEGHNQNPKECLYTYIVTTSRCCSRPGCNRPAVATLSYSYSQCRATLTELRPNPSPHSWDLCVDHAARLGAPVGWTLNDPSGFSRKAHPQNQGLTALAEAVSEHDGTPSGLVTVPSPPPAGAPQPPTRKPTPHPSTVRGRKRHHLYVVPDPPKR